MFDCCICIVVAAVATVIGTSLSLTYYLIRRRRKDSTEDATPSRIISGRSFRKRDTMVYYGKKTCEEGWSCQRLLDPKE